MVEGLSTGLGTCCGTTSMCFPQPWGLSTGFLWITPSSWQVTCG
ncbi:hypothetical protein HMPREF3223_01176 [Cutibacterium avidum]|nr:hypothetical protein HMPREF3223_01176 [Cutibacterium avidum]